MTFIPDLDEDAGNPSLGSAERLSGGVPASPLLAGSGLGLSVYCLSLSALSPVDDAGNGG